MFTSILYTISRRVKKRMATNSEGATAIEFAFVAPVFLMLSFGIVEFSMIMFTTAVMESATSNTARMGKTGYSAPGVSRQQQIINNIRDKTGGLLNPSLLQINTLVYSSFTNIAQPEPYTDSNHNGIYNAGEPFTDVNGNGAWDPDMGRAGLGSANDIVVYTVSYPWPIMTPVVSQIIGSSINLVARAVVKNEPF